MVINAVVFFIVNKTLAYVAREYFGENCASYY